jgi:hypothetical protein
MKDDQMTDLADAGRTGEDCQRAPALRRVSIAKSTTEITEGHREHA